MTERAALDVIDPPWRQDDLSAATPWSREREPRGGGPAPPQATKRLSMDIPAELHTCIKVIYARRGTKIADEVRALLEQAFRPRWRSSGRLPWRCSRIGGGRRGR